ANGLQHVTSVEVDGLSVVTEVPAPTLEFSSPTYSVVDNAGTATITVTRAINTAGSVTVHYATSDGSAHAGTDYTATSGDLSFADGETTKTFSIPIPNHGQPGSPLTLNLTLSNPNGNGAVLGMPSTAVLSISSSAVVHTITYDQITAFPSTNLIDGSNEY